MTKQSYNRKVIMSLVVGLIAIPLGISGWLVMYFVGMFFEYCPHTIFAVASIITISVAVQGMREIEISEETQKGRSIGIISIVIGVLNFLLLLYYFASY